MPHETHECEDISSYRTIVDKIDTQNKTSEENTYVFFTSVCSENGVPEDTICGEAEEILQDYLENILDPEMNIIVIYVRLPSKNNNEDLFQFRKEFGFRLQRIPTIYRRTLNRWIAGPECLQYAVLGILLTEPCKPNKGLEIINKKKLQLEKEEEEKQKEAEESKGAEDEETEAEGLSEKDLEDESSEFKPLIIEEYKDPVCERLYKEKAKKAATIDDYMKPFFQTIPYDYWNPKSRKEKDEESEVSEEEDEEKEPEPHFLKEIIQIQKIIPLPPRKVRRPKTPKKKRKGKGKKGKGKGKKGKGKKKKGKKKGKKGKGEKKKGKKGKGEKKKGKGGVKKKKAKGKK